MTELKLRSKGKHPLKSIVKAALQNELRLIESGIERTESILQEFERRYNMSTKTFLQQYENDQLAESLEFAEWIGEYRLLERLKEKASRLREVQFAESNNRSS